ncbi:acyl-CoA reductase [Niabella insulamsoli]|uniref:acyl-CoA reductase n=1 Tax=Niabella insulamsoli TaxID=3144874 RepID=UPI0031FDB4EE
MNLSKRIDLLVQLGTYIRQDGDAWQSAKQKAYHENGWFLPAFIDQHANDIADTFLQKDKLQQWLSAYPAIQDAPASKKKVGIVMAGNIPLVGFHDFLCVFISGHQCLIKPSSKDETLIKHLVAQLISWEPALKEEIIFSEMLKNCDAYIATGSNSSAGYFDYYFGKFPHIIRRNRTSVAVLTGKESQEDLTLLADDIFSYFGMGCRNVTKIYVPEDYDFLPLLDILKKYDYLAEHHKYKNNYDYNLALHLLNNKAYMSTPALLLVEEKNVFSPVSQLNYEVYKNEAGLANEFTENDSLQCVVGQGFLPFGSAQHPALADYADGVDTMKWLETLG